MPVCIVCERDLPDGEFYWRADAGRLARDCKDCKKGRAKQRYKAYARYDRYGITREQFEAQWARQGCKCALCGSADPGRRSGEWNIDHVHGDDHQRRARKWRIATGESFRGILCQTCNIGIGQFEKFAALVGRGRFLAYVESRVDGKPSLIP